jgi:hypothetical protein
MADGGFETAGSGRGVDICGREDSLLLVNDFRRDFMVSERENEERTISGYQSRVHNNCSNGTVHHGSLLLSS